MNSIFNLKSSEENNNIEIAVEIVLEEEIQPRSKMSPNLSQFLTGESSQSLGHLSNGKIRADKRFQCPHCDLYPSNRRSKIMKHIKKTHFPKYDFECLYCKKTFHSKIYLKLHIKFSHPESLKGAIVENDCTDQDTSGSDANVELLHDAAKMGCVNNIEIQDDVKPKLEIKEETENSKEGIDDALQESETVKVFIRSILNNIVDCASKRCGPRNLKVVRRKRRTLVKNFL